MSARVVALSIPLFRFAPPRLVPLRSARLKLAPLRLASLKSALLRLASVKLALLRSLAHYSRTFWERCCPEKHSRDDSAQFIRGKLCGIGGWQPSVRDGQWSNVSYCLNRRRSSAHECGDTPSSWAALCCTKRLSVRAFPQSGKTKAWQASQTIPVNREQRVALRESGR